MLSDLRRKLLNALRIPGGLATGLWSRPAIDSSPRRNNEGMRQSTYPIRLRPPGSRNIRSREQPKPCLILPMAN
jgi:hypothetical protein